MVDFNLFIDIVAEKEGDHVLTGEYKPFVANLIRHMCDNDLVNSHLTRDLGVILSYDSDELFHKVMVMYTGVDNDYDEFFFRGGETDADPFYIPSEFIDWLANSDLFKDNPINVIFDILNDIIIIQEDKIPEFCLFEEELLFDIDDIDDEELPFQ